MKQPKTKCKFQINDYVETTWGKYVNSEKGYRGKVTHIQYKERKGWRITVDFSETMSHPYGPLTLTFYQNDLRLVKSRQWLWYEIVAQQFKRWFKKKI